MMWGGGGGRGEGREYCEMLKILFCPPGEMPSRWESEHPLTNQNKIFNMKRTHIYIYILLSRVLEVGGGGG